MAGAVRNTSMADLKGNAVAFARNPVATGQSMLGRIQTNRWYEPAMSMAGEMLT